GSEDRFSNVQNFGADLKYGLTPDLTLNATFQPDFGQVEADPAVLNLSPFETFFSEKRPFFVEGSRFYQMPSFNMFYSRRIGTGDENARIRAATKLTGKMAGNVSVAGLYAATDITTPGRAHNFLQSGEHLSHFMVTRVGKDFAEGQHRVHLMQTAVFRPDRRPTLDDSERAFRDGYTTGMDFELNFLDRAYNIQGAAVGSVVDPSRVLEAPDHDHSVKHGTGGRIALNKRSGAFRSNVNFGWESPGLDLNDIGFLGAPNEMNSNGWVGWRYNAPSENPRLNQANLNINAWRGWVMGAADVRSEETGEALWQYGEGLPATAGGNVNGYVQFRNFVGAWAGIDVNARRTDIFITRGGPPMERPSELGGWFGIGSDWRKPFRTELDLRWAIDAEDGYFYEAEVEADWDASSRFRFGTDFSYWTRSEKADYLDTIDRGDPALGIGGQSYVFGDLKQQTAAITFRSNVLFDRSRSLELYFQPFVTVGDYTNARELLRPLSYDLAPYGVDGFEAADSDFSFGSVNVNVVYRWEYRPGSAFFLVWTHSRSDFETREDDGGPTFDNPLSAGELFRNEPENTVLAKFTYWLAL
ncbi:MAG: hypothetical protein HKN12_07940, partial [Gemmatimonadetes bacterium]|nr:hypothetical protein [Gemmatimonadota bacterium]